MRAPCATTRHEQQTRFYRASERVFDRMIAFYGRTLKFVLRYQTITLLVALGTLVLTIFLYIVIPKGFFPVQDTGVIQGISQAPATISFPAMAEKHQELAKVILRRSRRRKPLLVHRGRRHQHHAEQRTHLHQPEAAVTSAISAPPTSFAGCKPSCRSRGNQALHAAGAEHHRRRPREPHPVSVHASKIPTRNELNLWTNRFVDRLKKLPELEDVATDQQTGGLAVSLVIDRVTASRLGIAPYTIDNTLYDAYGQRQINTMYTQLNQYHVILEAQPSFRRIRVSCTSLYIQANASSGASGAAPPPPSPPPAPPPPVPMPPPLRPPIRLPPAC